MKPIIHFEDWDPADVDLSVPNYFIRSPITEEQRSLGPVDFRALGFKPAGLITDEQLPAFIGGDTNTRRVRKCTP